MSFLEVGSAKTELITSRSDVVSGETELALPKERGVKKVKHAVMIVKMRKDAILIYRYVSSRLIRLYWLRKSSTTAEAMEHKHVLISGAPTLPFVLVEGHPQDGERSEKFVRTQEFAAPRCSGVLFSSTSCIIGLSGPLTIGAARACGLRKHISVWTMSLVEVPWGQSQIECAVCR